MDECINVVHDCKGWPCALQRKGILTQAVAWTEPEVVALREITRHQRAKTAGSHLDEVLGESDS